MFTGERGVVVAHDIEVEDHHRALVLAEVAALPRVAPRLTQKVGDGILGANVKVRHNRAHTAVIRYTALCGYASYGAVKYTEDMVASMRPGSIVSRSSAASKAVPSMPSPTRACRSRRSPR